MSELTQKEAKDLDDALVSIQPLVSFFMDRLKKVVSLGFDMSITNRPDIVHQDILSWNEDKTSKMDYDDYVIDKQRIASIADSMGMENSAEFAKVAITVINKILVTDLRNPYFRKILAFYMQYDQNVIVFLLTFLTEDQLANTLHTGDVHLDDIGISPVTSLRRDIIFAYGSWRLVSTLPAPLICYSIRATYESGVSGSALPHGIGGLCQFVPFHLRNYADSQFQANIVCSGIGGKEMTLMYRNAGVAFTMHPSFKQAEMFTASTLTSGKWGDYSYNKRDLLWFSSITLRGLQVLRMSHDDEAHKVNSTVRPVNYRASGNNVGSSKLVSTHSLGLAADSRPYKKREEWVSMIRKDVRSKGPIFSSLLEIGIGGIGTYLSDYGTFVHIDSRSPELTEIATDPEATSSFKQSSVHDGMPYNVWEDA